LLCFNVEWTRVSSRSRTSFFGRNPEGTGGGAFMNDRSNTAYCILDAREIVGRR
jgi:hypothetical protein